jgi:hypothetical protein
MFRFGKVPATVAISRRVVRVRLNQDGERAREGLGCRQEGERGGAAAFVCASDVVGRASQGRRPQGRGPCEAGARARRERVELPFLHAAVASLPRRVAASSRGPVPGGHPTRRDFSVRKRASDGCHLASRVRGRWNQDGERAREGLVPTRRGARRVRSFRLRIRHVQDARGSSSRSSTRPSRGCRARAWRRRRELRFRGATPPVMISIRKRASDGCHFASRG